MPLPYREQQLPTPLEALSLKMKKGYSPLVCCVGDETGIGKSRYMLRMAELLYNRTFGEKWTPTENVFFSMTTFKEKLFNSEGKIFIIEEAEIELGSDDWQSISNKWFSRIKDTQRIKGNLYVVVLPIFMALARKHRRRVNWIIDVKSRGFANWWKIKKYSTQILGDELGKSYIGSVMLDKPDCDMEFDILDTTNKRRIEIEQGDLFDKEIKYKKLLQERKMQRLEKAVGEDKPEKPEKKTELFTYRCHSCQFIFNSETPIDKVVKCKNCERKVFIDIQNLVQAPESYKVDIENNEV